MRAKLVAAAMLAAACGSHASDDASAQSADVVGACDGSTDAAPDDLACTGLYTDVASKALSPRVHEFAPARSFWSDGADKTRWIDLPDGTAIDASHPDDWTFPVGTKAWKEIRVGGQRVETRFFWKVRDDHWLHAAYLWSADGASAHRVDGADTTVAGTPWHVPKSTECDDCHEGRRDRLLGFEAISLGLDGATGWNLAALAAAGRLAPPPAKTSLAIAEDATGKATAALGWLHVNCGVTCHNGTATATAYSTKLRLRLRVAQLDGPPDASWDALATTMGVDALTPAYAGTKRIVPGDPEDSLLVQLPTTRGQGQMPPIASTMVDDEGTGAVAAWIAAMTPKRQARDTR